MEDDMIGNKVWSEMLQFQQAKKKKYDFILSIHIIASYPAIIIDIIVVCYLVLVLH